MAKRIEQLAVRQQPVIALQNVGKGFAGKTVIETISFRVMKGETFSLFGPSGCGKTTILRLVAGLEVPDSGEIVLDSILASSTKYVMPPHKRQIGMVFQDLALWPHMTAGRHIDFALPAALAGKDRPQVVKEILKQVRLDQPERYPHQLSGGERQRLAIARALAGKPRILILDEPFSSLDSGLKHELLAELRSLVKRFAITMLYVTHQWQEVVELADRVAIMEDGRIVRSGAVDQVDADAGRSEREKTGTLKNVDFRARPELGG